MKTKVPLSFQDDVQFEGPQVDGKVRDFYMGAIEKNNVQPLRIAIAATHAGKPTRNNALYLPHKMRQSVTSFVHPFGKPILKHHDAHSDAIGRIVGASYIDLTQQLPGYDYVSSNVLASFSKGQMSRKDTLRFLSRYHLNDNVNPQVFDADYEGLGYARIIAEITDADAQQKILDGRSLTRS